MKGDSGDLYDLHPNLRIPLFMKKKRIKSVLTCNNIIGACT